MAKIEVNPCYFLTFLPGFLEFQSQLVELGKFQSRNWKGVKFLDFIGTDSGSGIG
jgi:hypothetical protein